MSKERDIWQWESGRQRWRFEKTLAGWGLAEAAVRDGEAWLTVLTGPGLWSRQGERQWADALEWRETADGGTLRLLAADWEMCLEFSGSSAWIERETSWRAAADAEFAADMTWTTAADGGYVEQGIIATHETAVEAYRLPYAFPAIVSKLRGVREADVAVLGDRYASNPALGIAVRRRDAATGGYAIGIRLDGEGGEGGAGQETPPRPARLKESLLLQPGGGTSFYELLGSVAARYRRLHPLPDALFGGPPTYRLPHYEAAARGLTRQLLDPRAAWHDGMGSFVPYGYQVSGYNASESFVAMDVLKGMRRYAVWLGDVSLAAFVDEQLDRFAAERGDESWIGRAHGTDGFFRYSWFGSFNNDNDGHEEAPNSLSTWKYYDRVAIFGELALLRGDERMREAFLRMMPFLLKLRYDGYRQAVTYDLATHLPVTGTEGGGSGGAAAMWGYIMLLAAELSLDAPERREEFLGHGLASLRVAASLGYFQMFSMRAAPKGVAFGWATRAFSKAYELTGDETWLRAAGQVSLGLLAHFYQDTNPYTYFPAYGFGYACARERWEAYREMAESLWLAAPLLKYTSDERLAELLLTARRTHLWCLPINGNPYGNQDAPYDSVDGSYIPFEFPTHHQGDNYREHGNGGQSRIRQTKEIYGSGEVYMQHQMFEAWATVADPGVLIVNPDAVSASFSADEQSFYLFNGYEEERSFVVRFKTGGSVAYSLRESDGAERIYAPEQLASGIRCRLAGRGHRWLRLSRLAAGATSAAEAVEAPAEEAFAPPERQRRPQTPELRLARQLGALWTLSWDAPGAGEPPVSHYAVYRRALDGAPGPEAWTAADRFAIVDGAGSGAGSGAGADGGGISCTVPVEAGRTYRFGLVAVSADGIAGETSTVQAAAPAHRHGWLETYRSVAAWEASGAELQSDGFMAIVQQPYLTRGSGGALRRRIPLQIGDFPYFELALASVNTGAAWRLALEAGGRAWTLQEATAATGVFLYDLRELLPADAAGWTEAELVFEIGGHNRSLAISYMRLFAATAWPSGDSSADSSGAWPGGVGAAGDWRLHNAEPLPCGQGLRFGPLGADACASRLCSLPLDEYGDLIVDLRDKDPAAKWRLTVRRADGDGTDVADGAAEIELVLPEELAENGRQYERRKEGAFLFDLAAITGWRGVRTFELRLYFDAPLTLHALYAAFDHSYPLQHH